MVEMNLGIHQENNIFRPSYMLDQPAKNSCSFALDAQKLTCSYFQGSMTYSCTISLQLIFSSKVKEKTLLPLISSAEALHGSYMLLLISPSSMLGVEWRMSAKESVAASFQYAVEVSKQLVT